MSNQEYHDLLTLNHSSENFDTYKKLGFIVDDEFDEKEIIDYFRKKSIYDTELVTYRILTTTSCNANCFYCYESEKRDSKMSLKTAHKVVDFIVDNSMLATRINIDWFGGEPLLNPKAMSLITRELNARLPSKNINYNITTNGLLFNSPDCFENIDLWQLQNIQITLDGLENTYNDRKQFNNVKNPFKTVISNIQMLLDKGLFVSIRINYDRDNLDEIYHLIDYLSEKYSSYRNLNCYVAPLFNTYEFEQNQIKSDKTTIDDYLRLNKYLVEKRLSEYGRIVKLKLRTRKCFACSTNSFVISPNGDLFKCAVDLKHSVGNIYSGIKMNQTYFKWCTVDLDEECEKCIFLPMCQGGCRAGKLGKLSEKCFLSKGIISDLIRLKCTKSD
ncbi:radical SAM protein [Amedibacillus dolichus]|uniref:Radical SAM protein n=1 Tax=Amedibacillus dolichus TaxID=31971 RepID=A0ABT7UBL7_9FIRM|nr:radical SAM protein [Amedibacillus dolichus]MDM8157022.1 radical SAM protein [Amedibacillus dolichus]